ncbi:response regulator [Archangium violaceum]|uniref:response regulator n=1 Tax=Archangium violaceum TaxID=83451 RepID=UPI0036DE6810
MEPTNTAGTPIMDERQKLQIALEEDKLRAEIERVRSEASSLKAPWWRSGFSIATLTAILTVMLPVTTAIQAHIQKEKELEIQRIQKEKELEIQSLKLKHDVASEDLKQKEAIRAGYLDRALSIDNRSMILRFVQHTAVDEGLKLWATKEAELIENEKRLRKEIDEAKATAAQASLSLVKNRKGNEPARQGDDVVRQKELEEVRKTLQKANETITVLRSQLQFSSSRQQANPFFSILWVDGDFGSRYSTHSDLEVCGISIYNTSSMEDARRLISQQSFKLVITDMERSGDSTAGYSLLRWIRSNHPALPVIMYWQEGGSRENQDIARKSGALLSTGDGSELIAAVADLFKVPCGDELFDDVPN